MRTWALTVFAVLVVGMTAMAARADEPSPRGPASTSLQVEFATPLAPAAGLLPQDGSGFSVISAPLDLDFDMVGVLWDEGVVSELWMKVRDLDGGWGEWESIPVEADHDRDETPGRPGSAAVFTGDATGVQFAIVGAVESAEVMAFNTEAYLGGGTFRQQDTVADLGEPPEPFWEGADFVRDRSEWDTADCRRDDAEFDWSSATALVIHHTAASNTYTQSQVPGIIAAHCDFHVNGRGWDDIGYNFLVDKFGDVWEGRTRSKTAPVQAAHTAGFNSKTQGIALMGTYETTLPTTSQLNGLRDILDWLTGWHSIDPTGTVTIAAGGGANGFDDGELVTISSIVGHRDLGVTSCPGDSFYATLATLRTEVAPENFGFDPELIRCDGLVPTRLGTPGNDLLYGTGEVDVIHGLGGNDWVFGLDGDDVICGGGGADTLIGGVDTDWISGDVGSDTCAGEVLGACETVVDDESFDVAGGLFRYYDIIADGTLGTPIFAGDEYTAGWSSITSVDLDGDGGDEIFFYRDDGLFRYYNIDHHGVIGSPILAGDGYTKDWTSITAVDLDGDGADEMLFYREDGLFRYYDIGADGVIGTPLVAGTKYTQNWTSITAVDLDGDGADELFFYREDGLFRYYDVREDGSLPSPMLAGDGYTADWQTITAIDLDGDGADELFFYRGDGMFRYYNVAADGSLPAPLKSGDWYTVGWTIVTAIDLDGDGADELFFYAG